jgi:TolB-like protein
LDTLTTQIVERLTEKGKSKVGINEFLTLKGEATDLGKFMAEELTTRLINSGQAQVVERRLLQKVLSEQEIGASQLVDDETAARIGKLLGADTLCVGTLTDLGQTIKVNARLISAETAEAYGAASAELPKNQAVMALLIGSGVRPPETVQEAPQGKARRQAAVIESQTSEAPPRAAAPAHSDPNEIVIYVKRPMGGEGPDTVQLRNKTRYCVKVWLNGHAARLIEGTQEVPCIPDGDKAFLRIANYGEYHMQASGSSGASPFHGIVAYDRKHIFSPQQKKQVILLRVEDFYPVP